MTLAVRPVGHQVPTVSWEDFLARFRWRQGEHVALVGPTGMGKTTLMLALLPLRTWVALVATKPRDNTLSGLRSAGWKITKAWPPADPTQQRWVLWCKLKGLTRAASAPVRDTILGALQDMFDASSWCIAIDDMQSFVKTLGIAYELDRLWNDGRSCGISMVGATQRPRHVPLAVWTMSTHLFIGRTVARDDLRHVSGLGFADPDVVRSVVSRLDVHQCCYVNTRTGTVLVTQAPRAGRG